MRKIFYLLLLAVTLLASCRPGQQITLPTPTGGEWITVQEFADSSRANSWLVFAKAVEVDRVGSKEKIYLDIAGDTKYWLWINDELVVREGGLKWGPDPESYYVDRVNIGQYLKMGKNRIEALLWYFGKQGFAHKSSGKAGLKIASTIPGFSTDTSWNAAIHPSFIETQRGDKPNYRLAESNISFDANQADLLTQTDQPLFGYNGDWQNATTFQRLEQGVMREIPQWKDFGLKPYADAPDLPFVSTGDTVVVSLPYNAQVTASLTIQAPASPLTTPIDIRTDNYRGGGPPNVRTTFTPRPGKQTFASPGWFNGHYVRYYIPAGITVHDLSFRETGYATEFTGDFTSNDPFYDKLWDKALRTLYVTMRDNYMDCPDRERAQWWGDVVLEAGETFYALDRSSDLLTRKALLELFAWQRQDSTIFSPIPAGNWNQELPTQMLASAGYFGLWNYYWHSGDLETLETVYPALKRYLEVWQTDDNGLVIPRQGGWTWGDWGDEKDMPLLFNGWYYLALKGLANTAEVLGKAEDQRSAEAKMARLKTAFNETFWNGKAYRSPANRGATDDRGQALAVVSGIAPKPYYPALREVFKNEKNASPYFEKYVLEALFQMGYADDALVRMKERFTPMVESWHTTLWEGWEIGSAKYGGGTYNHAWSGGGLTLLSQYVAGIQPTTKGYQTVRIKPQLGPLSKVEAKVDTPLGLLTVKIERNGDQLDIDYTAPAGMVVDVVTGKNKN